LKKPVATLLFFLYAFSFVSGQVRGPQDVVLLLDTSSLNEARTYIAGAFLQERVKLGDTFHLISFSTTARLEISRRIMGNDDLDSIRELMRTLPYRSALPDVPSALGFTEQYLASLAGTRQKKVVLVTGASNIQRAVADSNTRLAGMGATLEWVSLPGLVTPPAPPVTEQATGVRAEPDRTPSETHRSTPALRQDAPGTTLSIPANEETPAVQNEPVQPLETPPLPEIAPLAAPPKVITPEAAPPALPQIKAKPALNVPRQLIAAALIAFLCFAAAIALMCRQTLFSLNRAFALSFCAQEFDGPRLLSLFVEDQNTGIGRRNIHTISPGASLTLGGVRSDFLIFLVPLPQSIALIRFDGVHCIFIPQKKQFFPEATTKSLGDCIGKTIKIRTPKNYELSIRIMQHEAPLKSLNRLFNTVKIPGSLLGIAGR
jgi:hypothetical protein